MEPFRKIAVAGSFYPDSCLKLTDMINTFNRRFNRLKISQEIRSIVPQAIIVPHAGYIFSGYTANFAYRFLAPSRAKRLIVIGPSHYHYFNGISGSFYESYPTPCGSLSIDSAYLFALAARFNIGFIPQAHAKEHSTEVQMPFIQHYFPRKKVIELVYGNIPLQKLTNLIIALLKNRDNAVVISSDLSHFHTLKEAEELDKHCLLGVEHEDLKELNACNACGITGIKAVTAAAKYLKFSSKLLDYTTSAAVSGDTKSVVGYLSAMFYRETT